MAFFQQKAYDLFMVNHKKPKVVHANMLLKVFILIAFLTLVGTISTLVARFYEKNNFIQTRSALIELNDEFNRADQGWVYSESCRGKGDVYESEIPSSCAMSITNTRVNVAQIDIWNSIVKYKSLINEKSKFDIISNSDKQSSNASVYKVNQLPKGYCTLEALPTENLPTYYLSLTCRQESSQFYFDRNDL